MSVVVSTAVLALILALPTPTRAAIFTWRDTEGVDHYVDDLGNVPGEYRENVVTFVKDRKRPPSPVESVSPAPVTDPPVVPSVQIIEAGPSSFERGFWAGRESAIAARPAPAVMPVGSIVQNVQIIPSPQLATMFPVFGPFFGPVFPVPVRVHPRRAFAPKFRNRFIHRSAGVFVFGTSRPPSMAFFHRSR